jgi:hypothetical protein
MAISAVGRRVEFADQRVKLAVAVVGVLGFVEMAVAAG